MKEERTDYISILQRIEAKLDRIERIRLGQIIEKLDIAQLALDLRREREKAFPDRYFSDHAWDILLELYQANKNGLKIQFSLVGYEAKIPSTTALRYIDLLTRDNLLYREDDPTDHRRSFVIITPQASNLLDEVFLRFQDKIAEKSKIFETCEVTKSECPHAA